MHVYSIFSIFTRNSFLQMTSISNIYSYLNVNISKICLTIHFFLYIDASSLPQSLLNLYFSAGPGSHALAPAPTPSSCNYGVIIAYLSCIICYLMNTIHIPACINNLMHDDLFMDNRFSYKNMLSSFFLLSIYIERSLLFYAIID